MERELLGDILSLQKDQVAIASDVVLYFHFSC